MLIVLVILTVPSGFAPWGPNAIGCLGLGAFLGLVPGLLLLATLEAGRPCGAHADVSQGCSVLGVLPKDMPAERHVPEAYDCKS